ncbi:MAG: transcriptional regulator, partial [Sciscionella sp.]|nr:transcriptional regulator [Sciscionella sp.]
LDSMARVLNLDDDERAHLFRLARPVRGSSKITGKNRRAQRVRPGLRLLLDSMDNVPAFIVGRGMEVLAWNTLGNALCGLDKMPPDQRSIVRYFVLNEQARDLYPDWETVIAETVAFLRLEAGRYPDDEELAALVGELSIKSATFRELWARHNVREKTFGTKRFQHPVVGELTLSFETLRLPGDPDQAMVTYTAEPGSPSADALRLLASWTAESTSEHESERELRRN